MALTQPAYVCFYWGHTAFLKQKLPGDLRHGRLSGLSPTPDRCEKKHHAYSPIHRLFKPC